MDEDESLVKEIMLRLEKMDEDIKSFRAQLSNYQDKVRRALLESSYYKELK